jgi:hypothetical protein
VGVDHRGLDAVAEQLLDGADVVAELEQMGGERVAQGVAADLLRQAGGAGSPPDRALDDGGLEVEAGDDAAAWVDAVSPKASSLLWDLTAVPR